MLVDEDDSRSSSRVREHGSFLLVSQLHVAIQTLWSQCLFPRAVYTKRWIVQFQLISPNVFVCVFVLISTFNGHWNTTGNRSPCSYMGAFAIKQDTFVDLLSIRTVLLLWQESPCSNNWIFGLVLGLLEYLPPPATCEPNSFIHLSLKEIFGRGWGDAYKFSFLISPVSIMIAFGTQQAGMSVVKNDGVRSRLIELKSFPLRKIDVDPMHSVWMLLPCFMHVLCKTRFIPSQLHPDLCVPCSLDPQTWRIPSVFCSNFVLLVSILNSRWSVNWLHIRYDKCTRRNLSELVHCPAK